MRTRIAAGSQAPGSELTAIRTWLDLGPHATAFPHDSATGFGVGARAFGGAPAIVAAQQARPAITHGVQSGDVTMGRGDGLEPDRSAGAARRALRHDPDAAPGRADAHARADQRRPPTSRHASTSRSAAGQRIFYEAASRMPPASRASRSTGSFATPSRQPRAGDRSPGAATPPARAGASIPAHGGMRIYESMRAREPDLFIHSGDLIYADQPIRPEVKLADGTVWKNLVTEEVSQGRPRRCASFAGGFDTTCSTSTCAGFNAEVPMIAQWDDHEVLNNWYPGERLGDSRRRRRVHGEGRRHARGLRRPGVSRVRADSAAIARDPRRVYRSYAYGPLLEIFVLDCRTYRGAELGEPPAAAGADDGDARRGAARVAEAGAAAVARRVEADRLRPCRSACVVPDGPTAQEAFANGEPARSAASYELADSASVPQGAAHSQRRLDHRRRPLRRRARISSRRARRSPTSIRSGSSSPARCMPARSRPARSTRPSAPR